MAFKIVIDAGHGPNTPGKRSPNGIREFEFNYPTSLKLKSILTNEYEGVDVMLTANPSYDVALSTRTNKANSWGADAFVSIHFDTLTATWKSAEGISVFVYESRPPGSTKWAKEAQSRLIKNTGRKDRGVKFANFHVLRETAMDAILGEHGFMSHREEHKLMRDPKHQEACARAHAEALAKIYGLKRKSGKTTYPRRVVKSGDLPTSGIYKDGKSNNKTVVTNIQWALLQLGYKLPRFGADGDYGDETESAVKAFQKDRGISDDGIVGPITLRELREALSELHQKKKKDEGNYIYRIQAGAFTNRENAKDMADKLKKAGFDVFIDKDVRE